MRGEQTCERCGDDVHTLSTDGLCDGCVAEDDQTNRSTNPD